jgi:putative regulator of septum formation
MDSSFLLPGTTAPQIVVRHPALGSIKVFVDGSEVKRSSRRRLKYEIPLPDGTHAEVELSGQWTGLRATVNGQQIQLERRLARWELVLTFLPLVLGVIGGLFGALFAIGGSAVNARLARSGLRGPTRAIAMIGVTLISGVLFFGAALAIAPVPQLKTGTCHNNLLDGETVTVQSSRGVSCSAAHEAEVIGTLVHSGNGPFPGVPTLVTYGQIPCLDAFRSYVGVDFETSSLDMFLVVPSEITWAKGDRSIACLVITTDGSRITGTVKGTQR